MRPLLLLLPFALLPAALAAPVPPGTRAEFGSGGLLTRADLKNVKFDTQPAKRDDGREWPEDAIDDSEKREKKDGPSRAGNRYDLAVHMPWTKFREGEPVPAYFVLRNNGWRIGFGSSMDLSGTMPELHGGGMSLDVRDRATGKSVLQGLSASTNCGGGSLVDVPPDGYYCVKGDLARVCGGLPPGEYEVDWRCGRFASAPVRFTVTKGDGAKPPAPAVTKRTRTQFFHLTRAHEEERLADEPDVRGDYGMEPLYTESMTSALAVGQHDIYVPDVHTIPAADKLVEAWVQWKHYREGDRVSVTLRAVPPHKEVRFEEMPQLFLQVESDEPGARGPRYADEKQFARDRERLITPLTIEIGLPKDWRERTGASGSARVAVLISAKRIEMPRGREERLMHATEVVSDRLTETRPIWDGIVRTEFKELQFPQRSFPKR